MNDVRAAAFQGSAAETVAACDALRQSATGYVSPYGKPAGLRARMAAHRKLLGTPGFPWHGLGLVADLELVMRFLDCDEWLEAVRTGPDTELAALASDLMADRETLDAAYNAMQHVKGVETHDNDDPVSVIEALDKAATENEAFGRRIRDTLEQLGIVDDDTPDEQVPDLLRALLA